MTRPIERPAHEGAEFAASVPNQSLDLIGGRLEVVARMGGSGHEGAVLFRTSMAPGRLVPLHSHVDPECFYVLRGRLEVLLLDAAPRWHSVPAGRSVMVTDGIKHAVRNPERDEADLMVMTNARLAAFFGEAGRSAVPGSDFTPAGPADVERLVRAAQAYGYWLSSPAEHAAVVGGTLSPAVP